MREGLTLDALAAELERQQETKRDLLVSPERIWFYTADGVKQRSEISVLSLDNNFSVSEVAHSHFSDRLEIPKRYYERLRGELPALLDANVNRLLRLVAENGGSKWLIRTLDGVARAALSDQYRRIDHSDVAEALFPVLGSIPGVTIRSSALTDTHMYVKATCPRIRGEVVGQEVVAGVFIQNSEVGIAKFSIRPFVETLGCENGMTITRKGDGMMDQPHRGAHMESDSDGNIITEEARVAQDRAFMMTAREAVRTAMDEFRFRGLVSDMERAASDLLENPRATVGTLVDKHSLADHEGRGILAYLAEGGDLSRWGVISAVTRVAEDAESYDRATELEVLGGEILDYSPRQWRELALAQDS